MDLSALIPTEDTIEVTFKVQVGVTEDDKPKYEVLTKKDGDPCTWTLWAPHTDQAKKVLYTQVVDNLNNSKKKTEEGDPNKDLTVEEVIALEDKRIQKLLGLTKTFDLM